MSNTAQEILKRLYDDYVSRRAVFVEKASTSFAQGNFADATTMAGAAQYFDGRVDAVCAVNDALGFPSLRGEE